ncbi:MAG: class B sortase [Oscillospiraceae bacterium]|nr:class B sortase [Oscillospiraceae bacterium]
MKKRNTVKTILIVLCIILLCVFVYSGYKIITTIMGYKQAEKTYAEVANQFATVVVSPTPKPVESAEPQQSEDDGIDPEVSPLNIDFAGLRAQSSDYVGWIYSPNTVINYPIAYTDDNFYYLDHIPGEIQNANGTIFIDCRNASDFSDQNTCIYGHNMNDGSMFASLRNYRDANYYPEHPVIYLSTPDFNYRLDLIAGFITEPTSFAYANNFDSPEQFMGHIELIKDLSTFKSDVKVNETDKIVTLSTCTYERDDGRYVVVGKLTRIQ